MTIDLPYALRAWQRAAGLAFAERLRADPALRGVIQAATGTGKSRLAFWVIRALTRRALFLVHLDTLAEQVEAEARALFPDLRVGVVKAARDETEEDLVVASVQTLRRADRLAPLVASQARVGPIDLTVVDEAHHAAKGSVYQRILDALPGVPALGLTATPARTDRRGIGECFPAGLVYEYPIPRAVADGVLVPVSDGCGNLNRSRVVAVEGLDANLAALLDKGRSDLSEARRALVTAATARALAEAKGMGRRVVGFTIDVRAAEDAAAAARALGVRAESVAGEYARELIRARLRAHRAGELDALLCAQLLVEGYDDPGIDGVVWARPTISKNFYIQGVGRALRIDPARPPDAPGGKIDAVVWDLAGSHEEHGLVVAADIFGEETKPTPEVAPPPDDDPDAEAPAIDHADGRLRRLLEHLSGRRRLEGVRGAHVAWLEVAEGAFALAGADGATYVLERAGEKWVALREGRDRASPAVRLAVADTREGAAAAAEAAARAGESFDRQDAEWRARPASEKLVAACARWRIHLPPGTTAGDASDAITLAVARARRRNRPERGVVPSAGSLFL